MPRKAYSACLFLIAFFAAMGAHALSCVNPASMPEKPVHFEGVMLSASKMSETGHGCTYRLHVKVQTPLQGDVHAGDRVLIEQKHWICPQNVTLMGAPKIYALNDAIDGVHKVGMCGSLLYYPRENQEEPNYDQ